MSRSGASYVGGTTAQAALRSPIASRSSFDTLGNASNGTDTNNTYRSAHTAIQACHSLQLVYSNARDNAGIEADGFNSITVKCAVETSTGTIIPVFFNGARSVSIEAGGKRTTDPIGVVLAAGASFWVRTNVQVTAGQKWPLVFSQSSSAVSTTVGDGNDVGLDSTDAGTIATAGAHLYGPSLILGIPFRTGQSIVGIIGDSISAGSGDTAVSSPQPHAGWFIRALNNRYAFVQVSMSGESATNWNNVLRRFRRLPLLQQCTHLVVALGTNNQATAQADLTTLYGTLASFGVPLWGYTIPPRTTSTDAWATTGNQTVTANEAARVATNTFVRDGGGGRLTGYFEVADAVETARASGFWQSVGSGLAAAITGDGIHPNAAGYAQIAASISTASLQTAFGPVAV